MASTSVVLPWSTWAMMAILRIVCVTGTVSFTRVRPFGYGSLGGVRNTNLPHTTAVSILSVGHIADIGRKLPLGSRAPEMTESRQHGRVKAKERSEAGRSTASLRFHVDLLVTGCAIDCE